MKIFFSGPLTDLADPEKTKAFYKKLADVAKQNGFEYFWAFLSGTDPIANPDVSPQEVYQRDMGRLGESDIMVAYVGEPSIGTGQEIEFAKNHNIPIVLLYEKGKKVSRMLRGSPDITQELVFADEADGLGQFDRLLKTLKK